MLYFVDYDLRNKRDYTKLYDALAALNAVQVLESTWCLEYDDTTAENVLNHFKQFIDADDGLCATAVSSWATYNTNGNPNQLRRVPR